MASIGHQASAAEPRVNGIPRLAAAAMHPGAAFPNAVSPSNYRERYTMETHPYHIRSPSPMSLNRSGAGKTVSTSYQQQQQQMPTEASSSPIWQHHASPGPDMLPHHHQRHHQGTTHFQSVENSGITGGPGGGSSSRVSAMLGITSPESVSRGSPAASRQSSTSELYEVSGGTPSVSGGGGGDWPPPMVDSGMRYKMSSLSLLSSNSSVTGSPLQQVGGVPGYKDGSFGGMNEGAMIRELIGRLGGSSSSSAGALASSSPPPIPPHHAAEAAFGSRLENNGQHLGGFKLGGLANQNNWSPAAAATGVDMMAGNVASLIVDPSKGGLSLNSCGVGSSGSLPSSSSRCLSPFSADPGFAERAARFSSFNGNGNYQQQPQQQQQQHNFSSTSDGEGGARTLRSGSAGGGGGGASSLSETSSKHFSGNALLSSSRDRELSAGDPTSGTSNCVRPDRHSSHVLVEGSRITSGRVAAAAENHLSSAGLRENTEIEEVLDPAEHDSTERTFALKKTNSPPSTVPVKSFPGTVTALSRRSPLMATANIVDQDDSQGSGRNDGTSSPAGRIRRILTSSILDRKQQQQTVSVSAPSAAGAANDICHSSAGESTYTVETSEKKRKLDVDVRRANIPCDVAGSTSSSRGDRDGKTATEGDESKGKRLRRDDAASKEKEEGSAKAAAAERSGSETSGETSPRPFAKKAAKPVDAPKPDYIHVRARRGQATDSHSLAERVRREKISERMKFLQDLVPGCSKVTGKATMLDEIINYVQSLQRQVEFLSMKLASVSPRLDFNLESLVGKEGPHPSAPGMGLGSEVGCSISYPPIPQPQHSQPQHHQGLEYQLHSTEAALRRMTGCMTPSPVPVASPRMSGFGDGGHGSSGPALWDGDLQSIVQIGLGQSPSSASSPSSHCHLPPGQVKVELQQSPISCL